MLNMATSVQLSATVMNLQLFRETNGNRPQRDTMTYYPKAWYLSQVNIIQRLVGNAFSIEVDEEYLDQIDALYKAQQAAKGTK